MRSKVILLFILVTAQLFAQSPEEEATLIRKGDMCPDFSFVDENGTERTIAEFRGKTVMLVFFATWCGPCRKELKHLHEEVFPKFETNLNFNAFVFGREHTEEVVQKFKQENNYFIPFIADPKREIFSKFATSYIPRCYVIGKDGKVLFNSVSYSDEVMNELKAVLSSELK